VLTELQEHWTVAVDWIVVIGEKKDRQKRCEKDKGKDGNGPKKRLVSMHGATGLS